MSDETTPAGDSTEINEAVSVPAEPTEAAAPAAEEAPVEEVAPAEEAAPAGEEKLGRRRKAKAKGKGEKDVAAPKIDLVRAWEMKQRRGDIPEFRPGDTVRVMVKIIEGDKERQQAFEGICISRKHGSTRETFTVRKISAASVGVERTFFLHSNRLASITRVKEGVVRRAKIYYLRGRRGKAARIQERRHK